MIVAIPALHRVTQWTENEIKGYETAKNVVLKSKHETGIKFESLKALCTAVLDEMKKHVSSVRTYDSINARLRIESNSDDSVAKQLMTFLPIKKTPPDALTVTPSKKRNVTPTTQDSAANKLTKRQCTLNSKNKNDVDSCDEDCDLSSAGIT